MPALFLGTLLLVNALLPLASHACADAGCVSLSGDLRFRLEQDWDSQTSDATNREDRARARIRARLAAAYTYRDQVSVAVRARTGNIHSQQSPHVTVLDFSGNSTGNGNKDVLLDEWFARYQKNELWVWAGRNEFPFWTQDELFWNNDVTLIGGAAGGRFELGAGRLSAVAGYFLLPDGMRHTQGDMLAGQLSYEWSVAGLALRAGLGLFAMEGETKLSSKLRRGNGARDYTIVYANVQVLGRMGATPLKLGFDFLHNTEDYAAQDLAPFFSPADNVDPDDTDGYVLFVNIGERKRFGDILLGYYYTRIETFAVNASYAQNNWMRWGSATQTDASDFHGHELRAHVTLSATLNAVARLYLVESNRNRQDGKRFRLDFNWRF